jgi:uncharacterized protein YbjT (DUF2867 family)
MSKILLAGASGKLGHEILRVLIEKKITVRALARDPWRLAVKPDEVFVADARDAAALGDVCSGVDAVISALGASLQLSATKDRATFRAVDYQANLNLLNEAKKAGARKFVYVSMWAAPELAETEYFAAHEAFVKELGASGLDYTVMRPTGFFYLFAEVLKIAKSGVMPLVGDGGAKTNPIHEKDLATACVEALDSAEKEIGVGGPDILTRREIAEMAARAWGRNIRLVKVSPAILRFLMRPVRRFDERLGDVLDFGVAVSAVHMVAPKYGKQKLNDYFKRLVSEQKRG